MDKKIIYISAETPSLTILRLQSLGYKIIYILN